MRPRALTTGIPFGVAKATPNARNKRRRDAGGRRCDRSPGGGRHGAGQRGTGRSGRGLHASRPVTCRSSSSRSRSRSGTRRRSPPATRAGRWSGRTRTRSPTGCPRTGCARSTAPATTSSRTGQSSPRPTSRSRATSSRSSATPSRSPQSSRRCARTDELHAEEGQRLRLPAAHDQQPDRRPDLHQPGCHRGGPVPGAHPGQQGRGAVHHRPRPDRGPAGASASRPAACPRTRPCSSRT